MEINKQILYKLKNSVVFFNKFTIEELITLLKASKKEIFYKDANVFKEKTFGDNMYIIVSGKIAIMRKNKGVDNTIITLTSGNCFGEMALIDDSPRSATAKIVSEKSEVLAISETILRSTNLQILYKLFRGFSEILTQRLRETNQKFTEISLDEQSTALKLKNVVKRITTEKEGNLSGSNLSKVNLSDTFFNSTKMENSLFIEADFNLAKFKEANLSSSNYTTANFNGCTIQSCNFSDSHFTATNFQRVIFRDCKFNNSNMRNAFTSRTTVKNDSSADDQENK